MTAHKKPHATTIELYAAGFGVDRTTAEVLAILGAMTPEEREAAIRDIRQWVEDFEAKREAVS